MVDFVLGAVLAGMLVRGWLRGFVREILDLVGLVLGIWVAFRLSGPFGDFLTTGFGVSPEVGRIAGGIVLFVLFGVLLGIAARLLSKVMNLPGLSLINRVGGALVAIAWGALIVLIVVSLAQVVPLPASWRAELGSSRVVGLIAGEAALPRSVFESLAGDNVMAAMSAIRDLFGSSRAVPVGDQVLDIPPAGADEIRQVRAEADVVLERLNEHRVGMGLGAVTEATAVTDLAEDHGAEQYRTGQLRRIGDCAAVLATRNHQVLSCDNGVALAATSSAAFAALLDTPETRAVIETPTFDRAGVAVVDGTTGRLLVVILAG